MQSRQCKGQELWRTEIPQCDSSLGNSPICLGFWSRTHFGKCFQKEPSHVPVGRENKAAQPEEEYQFGSDHTCFYSPALPGWDSPAGTSPAGPVLSSVFSLDSQPTISWCHHTTPIIPLEWMPSYTQTFQVESVPFFTTGKKGKGSMGSPSLQVSDHIWRRLWLGSFDSQDSQDSHQSPFLRLPGFSRGFCHHQREWLHPA